MQQVTNEVLVGAECSHCSCTFADKKGRVIDHGHPVLCKPCWREASREERRGMQKAKYEEAI